MAGREATTRFSPPGSRRGSEYTLSPPEDAGRVGLLGISRPEPVCWEGSVGQNFSGVCSE